MDIHLEVLEKTTWCSAHCDGCNMGKEIILDNNTIPEPMRTAILSTLEKVTNVYGVPGRSVLSYWVDMTHRKEEIMPHVPGFNTFIIPIARGLADLRRLGNNPNQQINTIRKRLTPMLTEPSVNSVELNIGINKGDNIDDLISDVLGLIRAIIERIDKDRVPLGIHFGNNRCTEEQLNKVHKSASVIQDAIDSVLPAWILQQTTFEYPFNWMFHLHTGLLKWKLLRNLFDIRMLTQWAHPTQEQMDRETYEHARQAKIFHCMFTPTGVNAFHCTRTVSRKKSWLTYPQYYNVLNSDDPMKELIETIL